jgi:hypothetical protein
MYTDERNKTQHAMDNNDLALLADTLPRLASLGKRLRAKYEWLCDHESDPQDCDADGNDLQVLKMQEKADAIAANVGLYVYHQTDCRGAALYVSFFPIPDNDYTHAVCLG